MVNQKIREQLEHWQQIVQPYKQANTKIAVTQILNTFIPIIALWTLTFLSLEWSYWLTFIFALSTGAVMIRAFVIQHDCGHQSFLKSKRWNNAIGFICSFITSIPYKYWSRMHNVHHAHNSQFEYRGLGDIHFLTTEEYFRRNKITRFYYRLHRTVIMQFIIVPIVYFTIVLRFPFIYLKKWKNMRMPHLFNNISLVIFYFAMGTLLGWQKFLITHGLIMVFFAIFSFWLFYVQHQHEDNYNVYKDDWEHLLASILGSTYYKLPPLFQWLSGNIGFHHVHHLNSRIPNYNLERCVMENPELSTYANILDFKDSVKCMSHKLWDKRQKKMITFKEYDLIPVSVLANT